MIMHRNLILLVFLLLLISINGQDDGDRDLPKGISKYLLYIKNNRIFFSLQ
jgi:hypothetical protein